MGVPIDCVGAPSPDGAPFGTELSPGALRAAGVGVRLAHRGQRILDAGDLPVRLIGRDRDPATGVTGWPGVARTTKALRDAVAAVVATGEVPVLLGGCCTLLPGALAGARDALAGTDRELAEANGALADPDGGLGLAYFDGHLDLYDGVTSPTGEPADMPMAVIAGVGPAAWTALVDDAGAPLVAPGRVALIGPRDRDEAVTYRSVLPEHVGIAPEATPAVIRRDGTAAVAADAARRTGRRWVHVDVDVLDEAEMPATDYLAPGGLTFAELAALLAPLTRAPDLVGFSLACYNPQKDPGGAYARRLVDLLADLFSA